MEAKYDHIGKSYSATRCTDPRIAEQLYVELVGATRIINIGAGTGSYEPDNVDLVAVEPSSEMIAQRKPEAHPVIKASAEHLPFEDNSFSHAMTVLSIHHWTDRVKAFEEINRIATEKFVAITWDPKAEPFWLTRDYFPQMFKEDLKTFHEMSEFEEYFDDVQVKPILIPHDCQDGFLAAFWKRPEAYLDEEVRNSISTFSKINDPSIALNKLKDDLSTGLWQIKNKELYDLDSIDAGYRLVTAKTRKS